MTQSDIRHFFTKISERSLFINNLIFGNIDLLSSKMQGRSGQDIQSPLLMIDVISSTSDQGHKKFKIHALIGAMAQGNDIDLTDRLMDTCDVESDNFKGYIERNFRSINAELDFKFTNKYPYMAATGDNIYGWIWDIDVTSKFECNFTNSFNMDPSTLETAKFTWIKTGDDIIIDGMPSGAGYTNDISVKNIGSGDYVEAINTIPITQYYQVVLLKTTKDSIVTYAYALIFPNEKRAAGVSANLGKNEVV